MTGNRLSDYLEHVFEAARLACAYVAPMTKAEFFGDTRTQQAVVLNIIVIGEAASRLLQEHGEFLERHPGVPWRSMRGMRNRVAHGYFSIDLDIVWDTVRTALPELLQQLPRILEDAREWEATRPD
jgi:uncharacterized protein with HEPN domain